MLINLEGKLAAIFHGCLHVSIENARIHLSRFTEKQLEFYQREHLWAQRTGLTAGISLDFYTESSFVQFDYEILYNDREWYFFDLLVNGIFADSYGEKNIKKRNGTVRFDIKKPLQGMNRVTVFLPHTVAVMLSQLTIADDAGLQAVSQQRSNLLCIGDSILQGMDCFHPYASCAVRLARFLNSNLLNQSVGGVVFDKGSLDENLPFNPDCIVVAYGTNDWTKSSSSRDFESRVEDFFQKLKEIHPHAQLLVVTPLWRKGEEHCYAAGSMMAIRKTITQTCKHISATTVIDGLHLVPPLESLFDDRGVHPQEEGHLFLAFSLLATLIDPNKDSVSTGR
jgi:hypothetical protein